uniref:Glutamine amidotransferase type-2 domain-containing protein n=1 Tax=Lygus hesperus TaxID=30085 RepID=A0A0K8T8K4_LYGHE
MCGINVIISSTNNLSSKLSNSVVELRGLLSNRGPDCQCSHEVCVPDLSWHIAAYGSTLWTQGPSPTHQPLITDRGSFLLWNGDVYDDNSCSRTTSDSALVLQKFEEEKDPLKTLSGICGPYAFIFYDPDTRSIWFGRDPIGRCSLLIHAEKDLLVISSVASRSLECVEVPSHGIFRVVFNVDSFELLFHPWADTMLEELPSELQAVWKNSIEHIVLNRRHNLNSNKTQPDEDDTYSRLGGSVKSTPVEMLEAFCDDESITLILAELMRIFENSVRCRVSTCPRYCQRCAVLVNTPAESCLHTKVAVLFSGGLDSTILAVLADRVLDKTESIDLFNIAFERTNSKASQAPDRVTGYVALEELKRIAPYRTWNFVEITVGETELNEHIHHIADLIHPLNSVLDESLGCALWFAARGKGLLNHVCYESPARVVLVGMGADELFGGYSRHAKVFNQTGSWSELGDMLHKEVQNIGSRNMGRDNRVILDHGRMMRAPFLDETVVSFVNKLPPWVRCNPGSDLPRGVGDKTLLRLLAFTLGLRETAVQPKRALQFGSRIANSKQKGHEISTKLAEKPIKSE